MYLNYWDIALLENTPERAQKQLDAYCLRAKNVRLEINITKTEEMRLNQNGDEAKLTINGEGIEIEDDFKYLGSHLQ